MKNILKVGVVALASVSLLSGCIKETFPTSVATSEQVESNPVGLEAMVNGMAAFLNSYDVQGGGQAYDWGYPSIGLIREAMGDWLALSSSGYEWYGSWQQNSNLGEQYARQQFIWNFYTQYINTSNSVLRQLSIETASDLEKPYLAMAYCYRAHAYLDMGQMYEFKINDYTTAPEVVGLTVPIVDENTTEAVAANNPRVSKEVMAEFIEGDLDNAIALFGEGYKRSSVTQPDLSVAYGLKARLYMWTGEYDKAKDAAQKALAAGHYTPLTEAEWTNTSTGFNKATSAWMWASSTVKEDRVVTSGILNWISWISSETSFGYAAAGAYRYAATAFYNKIADTDFRKLSWKAPEDSDLEVPLVESTADYDNSWLDEYTAVKFRPGSGNPDEYDVAAVADYPLMRMEEMEFIIAECDAREGNIATLEEFIQTYRNPEYQVTSRDLVEEVLLQKTIEFWGEGIIYFDYKRMDHSITRSTSENFPSSAVLDTYGLAPWMNFVAVQTEPLNNRAFINNPDPSGTVK